MVLTTPNGGETFEEESQQTIQWIASDNVGITAIDLYYSMDGGISWNPIVLGISGTQYLWTLPQTTSSNCRIKVVAFDAAGNVGQDISDGSFIIVSGNRPPYPPNNPSPSNGVSGATVSPVLTWSGGDPDIEDTVTYDVYFGASGNLALVSSGQTGNSYSPGSKLWANILLADYC
jgi:hypothetical protein